jgi:hypothetical protein
LLKAKVAMPFHSQHGFAELPQDVHDCYILDLFILILLYKKREFFLTDEEHIAKKLSKFY